ncbi:hypothetical protein ABNG03_03245 [Halorubrum sp. RMP-47]|uniref:DUF1102 domain-containing protein n=1 Tax=Halorubrum miltondacostae TaxID=3076378 RepID=A0ABD5M101_9EURY
MKPTRRKAVLGLGALATGSGAVFSSGAFASATASSTADIGVVVEGNLIVEAGASFRNNNGYNPNTANNGFYGDNTSSLFTNLDNNSGNEEQFDNNTVSVDNLPAARVNSGSTASNNLNIQVAMPSEEDNGDPFKHTFEDVLQVRNEGTEPAEVGIKYSGYGEDVGSQDPVSIGKVREGYKFKSAGDNISPTKGSSDNENAVEVGVGETKQIWLEIDLSVNGNGGNNLATEIAEAAEPTEDEIFNGGAYDTVDILDEVTFGDELDEGN